MVASNDMLTVVTATSDNQTDYSFDFRADAGDDLKVLHISSAGVRKIFSFTTGFTVTGLGQDSGGTVTLTDASGVSNGDTLYIYASKSIARSADYAPSGDFSADDIDAELDALFLIANQLERDITRAVKEDYGTVPATATTAQLEDVSHAINTAATKVEGYMVKNLTTGLFVFANGNADADTWKLGTGTVAHTPV